MLNYLVDIPGPGESILNFSLFSLYALPTISLNQILIWSLLEQNLHESMHAIISDHAQWWVPVWMKTFLDISIFVKNIIPLKSMNELN